jgi:hypothetical protein
MWKVNQSGGATLESRKWTASHQSNKFSKTFRGFRMLNLHRPYSLNLNYLNSKDK